MILFWAKNGNKSFSIDYDKFNLRNIFRTKVLGGKRGIDSYIEKDLWLFGLKFSIIDVNYDNIIFIKINSKDNYTKCKNSRKINILKETLISWVETKEYLKNAPPFNWNIQVNGEGDYTFYITGKKEWFYKNGLDDLVNAFREIVFDESEKDKFPKYNPNKTNKYSVIK